MPENKRFELCVDSNNQKSLWDNEKKDGEPLLCLNRFDEMIGIDEVYDLLNEQDADLMMQREKALYWRNKAEDIFGDMQTNVELKKENIKLKERIKKLKLELNTHKHPLWSTRQCQERIRELENENKQLKAQLEKGGDVCSICKYEYLVASTEYYIAQCKKGHDECSKGDVDYCKDFELKGDVE